MAAVRALVTFHAPGRLVIEGDEIDAKDSVVKGREALFEAVEEEPKKAPARKKAASS